MDESESRMTTIGMGCFAFVTVALFVAVYSPLLWSTGRGGSLRPMSPLPLAALVLGMGGWIPCVVMGVRQLLVKPRYYGGLTIGIGVLQMAAFRLAEWVLVTSRGYEWGS